MSYFCHISLPEFSSSWSLLFTPVLCQGSPASSEDVLQGLLLLLAAQRPFFPPLHLPPESPWLLEESLLPAAALDHDVSPNPPQPAPQHSPGLVLRFLVCLRVMLAAAVSQGSQSYKPSALTWGEQAPFVWG